jgi:hypothetical protein
VAKPRLFFNLTKWRESLLDDEGLEVADLDDAMRSVMRAIHDVREERQAELDLTGWRLDVVDQSGRVRASVTLA